MAFADWSEVPTPTPMNTKQILRLSLALLLAMTAINCRSSSSLDATDDPAVIVMQRTELFLGLKRPKGADITDAEFQAYLEEEVTPRFPRGYTVVPAEGRWRGAGPGDAAITIREPSRLLIILYEPTAKSLDKINQIKNAYIDRFDQEAVLRTDSRERVSF